MTFVVANLCLLLWLVPVAAYRYARRTAPHRAWRTTGVALGVIACPASFGLYTLFWDAGMLGAFGLPLMLALVVAAPGLIGLLLMLFHGAPADWFLWSAGLTHLTATRGDIALLVSINAVVWAFAYGAAGWLVDVAAGSRNRGAQLTI